MTNALALTGLSDKTTIEVTERFIQLREDALKEAAIVTAVTDGNTQQLAVNSISDLKRLRLGLENARKARKEPVVALGKRIDSIAKEAGDSIVAEEARLTRLVTDFTDAQRRAAEEAERQRLAKVEAEQREAARLQREAEEREREAGKARMKAATVKSEAARLRAEEAARKADADANRLSQQAEEAKTQAAETASTEIAVTAPVVVGASSREVWDFEVTDAIEFAASRPDLCIIAIKRAEVLRLLNSPEGLLANGIRSFKKTKVSVR